MRALEPSPGPGRRIVAVLREQPAVAHDGGERRLGGHELDQPTDVLAHHHVERPVELTRLGEALVDRFDQLVGDLVGHRGEQLLLRSDDVVDHRSGHLGVAGDARDRDAVVPVLGERSPRHPEDPLLLLVARLGPWPASSGLDHGPFVADGAGERRVSAVRANS